MAAPEEPHKYNNGTLIDFVGTLSNLRRTPEAISYFGPLDLLVKIMKKFELWGLTRSHFSLEAWP